MFLMPSKAKFHCTLREWFDGTVFALIAELYSLTGFLIASQNNHLCSCGYWPCRRDLPF